MDLGDFEKKWERQRLTEKLWALAMLYFFSSLFTWATVAVGFPYWITIPTVGLAILCTIKTVEDHGGHLGYMAVFRLRRAG